MYVLFCMWLYMWGGVVAHVQRLEGACSLLPPCGAQALRRAWSLSLLGTEYLFSSVRHFWRGMPGDGCSTVNMSNFTALCQKAEHGITCAVILTMKKISGL